MSQGIPQFRIVLRPRMSQPQIPAEMTAGIEMSDPDMEVEIGTRGNDEIAEIVAIATEKIAEIEASIDGEDQAEIAMTAEIVLGQDLEIGAEVTGHGAVIE